MLDPEEFEIEDDPDFISDPDDIGFYDPDEGEDDPEMFPSGYPGVWLP